MDSRSLISNSQSSTARRRYSREEVGGSGSTYGRQIEVCRPRAVKAAAIHPPILQEFQQQCAQERVPEEVHRVAVLQSNEWHRRWTFQQEHGHTHPHDDDAWQFSFSPESSYEKSSRILPDRAAGAKNPSLDSSNGSSPCGSEETGGWSSSTNADGVSHQHQPVITDAPLLRPVARQFNDDVSPFHLPDCLISPSPYDEPQSKDSSHRPDTTHVGLQLQLLAYPDSPVLFTEPLPSPLTLPSASSVASGTRLRSQHSHSGYESSTSTIVSSAGSLSSLPSTVSAAPCEDLEAAKDRLLEFLAVAGGDVYSHQFKRALIPLWKHYRELGWDAREPPSGAELRVEGMWLTLSKPTFFGNLGETSEGDPMYTLGRMAFDMFLPTQLVVSLQGNFNPVHIVPDEDRRHTLSSKVPKALNDEVVIGNHVLRTYNIVSAFTVEPSMAAFPDAPNKNVRRPIKGIMTTYGYVLPDPNVPNRLSIWFTGGKIAPNDDPNDQLEWKRLFGSNQPKRTLGEKARVLAANLLMGAEVPKEMNMKDGSFEYTFSRPLGGHGVAFMDVIYLDNSLRVCRGHRGTIFVFARIPDHSVL